MCSGRKELCAAAAKNYVQRRKELCAAAAKNFFLCSKTRADAGASASRVRKVLSLLFAYLLAEPAINKRTAYDHHEWDRQMADRVDRLVVLASLTSALAPLSAPPSLSQSKTDRLNERE